MKRLSYIAISALFTAAMATSCGGGQNKENAPAVENAQTVKTPELSAEALSAGQAVYKAKCQACHQENGLGVANTFPPLAGSDYLKADIPRAIRQAVKGSTEPLTVNGVTYKTSMAPVPLTEQEHTDVINYVLNSWGNSFGVITTTDIRAALAK